MTSIDSAMLGIPVLIEYEDAACLFREIPVEEIVPPRRILTAGVIQNQTPDYIDVQIRFSPNSTEHNRGVLIPVSAITHIWKLEQ